MNTNTKKAKSMNTLFIIRFGIIFALIIIMVTTIAVSILEVRVTKDDVSKLNEHKSVFYMAEAAHYKWATDLAMAINYDEEFKGSLDPTQCAFGKYIYDSKVQNDPNFKAFLDMIIPIHEEIHLSAKDVLADVKTNETAAHAAYQDVILPKVVTLVADIDTFVVEKTDAIEKAENGLDGIINIALIVCVLSVLAVTIACIETFIFIRREIILPLAKLDVECQKLAQGKLTLDLDTNRKTYEMQKLAESLDESVQEIQKYIGAIDFGMTSFANGDFSTHCPIAFLGDFATIQTSIEQFQDKMGITLSKFGKASQQVLGGADQVSSGAQSLAQGATEQASSIQELSASISEISNQVKMNASNSVKASTLASDATSAISGSNEQMRQLMESMADIDTKSNEISKIIKTIEDIAFQTNILALNAAVEAARAGVAGKGFAVVADEVRNLAGKSAEAAKNTTQLIEDSVAAITHGVNLTNVTASELNSAVNSVSATTEVITEITKASNDQAQAIEQVSLGIEQINAVVQVNCATSEESAAVSEELSSQANLLNELVSQFKTMDSLTGSNNNVSHARASKPVSHSTYTSNNDYDSKY